MEWLISHVDILQSDGNLYKDYDVLIRENCIHAVEKHSVFNGFERGRVIDGRQKLMVPGFINAHFHSHDRLDRGRTDNLPLELWMNVYNTPLGSRTWTPEDCYLRTLLTCLEQIKSGVTTVIDDVFHGDITNQENVDAVYQAYADSGLRAMVTAAASDLPYFQTIPFIEQTLPPSLKKELACKVPEHDIIFDLWKRLADKHTGLVSFAVSTSGPQRCSDDFLKKAHALAGERNLPIFTHILETKTQELTGYLTYGKGVVEHMDDLGLLSPATNLVHGVWLDAEDMERIVRTGSRVIHNPLSNLKLGSGIAPIAQLMEKGVPVGLGTDNNNCNDSVNLIEAMKMAALISKVNTGRYQNWIGAEQALKMATSGGSACYGSDKIGALFPGAKADFSLFDLTTLSFFPCNNPLNQLVYAENGSSLDMVVANGKILMEKGHVTIIDEANLINRLNGRMEKILSMIEESSKRSGDLSPYINNAYDLCLKVVGIGNLERN